MIKVDADPSVRTEIVQIVEIFRANIVDVGKNTMIIELTGDKGKVNAMEELLAPFGIKELVHYWHNCLNRGSKPHKTNDEE